MLGMVLISRGFFSARPLLGLDADADVYCTFHGLNTAAAAAVATLSKTSSVAFYEA